MVRQAFPSLAMACVLYGVYTLYSLFLSPLFSPPAVTDSSDKQLISTEKPRHNVEQARKHLPDVGWAVKAPYQFRRDDTYFYAEDWEKVEPHGHVRFKPFAMIWHRDGEQSGTKPITIRAESALLQFERPFDEADPNPGRLVGGALEGVVQIKGDSGLQIDTSNIRFSEEGRQAWSNELVKFQFGPHHGQGFGLALDLLAGEAQGDKPAIDGISALRLQRDVQMELVQQPEQGSRGEIVRIKSDGTFEYNVLSRVGTFKEQVHVDHPTEKNEIDTLDCALLTLYFEEADAAAPGVEARKTPKAAESNLELRRLKALGLPGKPAVVTSQRGGMTARMNELHYDVPSRVIRLLDKEQAVVVQKLNEMTCGDITVVHNAQGDVTTAICRGVGQLLSFEPPLSGENAVRGRQVLNAKWSSELRKDPDGQKYGLDLISLDGNAVVEQAGRMTLRGDVIRLWVQQLPKGAPQSAKKKRDGTELGVAGSGDARPKRIEAMGRVAFSSDQLTGTTAHLDALFEDGKLPLVRPGGSVPAPRIQPVDHRSQSRRALPPAERNGDRRTFPAGNRPPHLRETTARLSGFAAVESESTEMPPAPPPGKRPLPKSKLPFLDDLPDAVEPKRTAQPPAHIIADTIKLRVVQDGDKSEVAEVWNDGHVKVTQQREGADQPFELRGEHLHVLNYAENDQVIDLSGPHSHVQDRGFEIDGPKLFLDRLKNIARVDGEGRLRLPIRSAPDGKPLAEPQPLDVSWSEKMTFDGRTANFFGAVRGSMAENRMKCELMTVTFAKPVSLSEVDVQPGGDPAHANAKASGEKTEIKLLHCRENVEVESREYANGEFVSFRKAKAWEFTLNPQSGETTASGPPGELTVWNRGGARRAGLAGAGVQANKPLQAEQVAWEFTRITFAGGMTGNTKTRSTKFQDRVVVVYGPVKNLGEVVDPDNLPRDGSWMRGEQLELTQHAAVPEQPAYFIMLAKGNAEIHGRPGRTSPLSSFDGQADQVSFDESKGQYLLRSTGNNRNATIWRQSKPGAPRNNVVAQRMEFYPARNGLKMSQTSGLDFSD